MVSWKFIFKKMKKKRLKIDECFFFFHSNFNCICQYSVIGAGLAVLSIPLESHSYLVGFSSAMYGLCLGCWYLLVPVLLADIFGTERISSSYGLIRMFQSLGAISVPPLAGFLKDLTGGYEVCFYCMGACMVLGSVPLIVLTIIEPTGEATSNSEESEVTTVSN